MKIKLFALLVITVLFTSCSEKGEIKQDPIDFIVIHGKTYKLMSIVPANNERPIWIMYPKDSTDAIPTVINYGVTQSSGKSSTVVNRTIIKVD